MDKKQEPGELESICIEAAENGYMVVCRMCPPKPKKGQPMGWADPERYYVYETPEAVLSKVKALLGGIKSPKRGMGLAGLSVR